MRIVWRRPVGRKGPPRIYLIFLLPPLDLPLYELFRRPHSWVDHLNFLVAVHDVFRKELLEKYIRRLNKRRFRCVVSANQGEENYG